MADKEKKLPVILVLDDDEAICRVIKRQLEGMGFSVLTQTDGQKGLDCLRGVAVSAVLLDLNLGSMSGFELLPQIKKIKPDLPIIMVTGSHDEEEARRTLELGAWDYVTKPIDFNYLKNVLVFPESADPPC